MGIRTSGYETIKKLKERPLLWERSTLAAPEDVATSTIPTDKPQQGDEAISRTKSQSNVSSEDKGTKNGESVQGDGKRVVSEEVKEATFGRLKDAIRGVFYAIKSGEGKEEAISELKRVVKECDKGEAAKNFLNSYWQVDRFIKYDGGKVSKEHALILEVLGYLRDALTENGVGVIDGVKGVKMGDVVCYKKKDFKDAKGYYEKTGRAASVDRGSVVMDDGAKVGKRSVLGYCRVGDDGKVEGETKGKGVDVKEDGVKGDVAHEGDGMSSAKVEKPKVEDAPKGEKAKTNVEDGKADGGKFKKGGKSEKSKKGDGVAMGNGTDSQGNPLNGDGVQGGEVRALSAEELRVFSESLMGAVNGVFKAIKGGDEGGKVEAIEGLKRMVGEWDKVVAAEAFLDRYWHLVNSIKKVGEDAKKKMGGYWSEAMGVLRDVMVENGVGVMDGGKGIEVGDVVCFKVEIPEEEKRDNLEYVIATDRVSEVKGKGVVLSNGGEVKKGNVLGYCRVGGDGLNGKGEKPKEMTSAEHAEMGGVTVDTTDKSSTEKSKEKSKEGDAAVDGSEKKPKGVKEPNGETASVSEKKPIVEKPKGDDVSEPKVKVSNEKKSTEEGKPKDEKKGESEERIDDVGEKIAGARKDVLSDMAKKFDDVTLESLIALPFAKAFKRPNLRDAVEKGVLRERDARFADAVMSAFLSKAKPRLLTGWKAMKSKREIEAWAKEAYNGVKLLKMLMDVDEGKRDALIDEVMGLKMYDEEVVKAKQRQYEEWNEGKKYEGECYPINLVKLFMDVYERLGYDSYGEVKLPFAEVKPDMTFDSYDLYGANGKRFYLRRKLTSYEDVVDEAVYLTKLMVADEGLDHPKDRFKLKGDDPIYETIGWIVQAVTVKGKKQSAKQHVFETKEEAEKFREEFKEKMGKNGYVGSAMEDKKFEAWGSFEIAFHNDLTDAYVGTGLKFKSREEAEAAIEGEHERLNEIVNGKLREALEASGEKTSRKKDYVSVMQMLKDGKWKYAVVLDDKYAPRQKTVYNTMPYTLAEGFETKGEAEKYIEEHRGEIDARVEEVKKRRREFVYFNGKESPRVGEDYRKGEDVTAEQFREQFGFRGVQFGNWANQRDRQAAVNNAFDGFMDLARVLGVSPRALSLNGELGIAFGARGGGKASAHYELNEVVINLTKTKGAGSLAHEWWHALDNYFARRADVKLGMVTENKELKMREELRGAFNALVDGVEKSDYNKRSSKEGVYWGSRSEETARLFETWVSDELMKRGESNSFLTSRDSMAEERFARMNYTEYKWFAEFAGKEAMGFEDYKKTASALNGFVYPTRGELDVLGLRVRKIFDTIQTRVDEGTRNVVMYHRGRVVERVRSKAERALLDALIGVQRGMGLKVVTDVNEGERVLRMARDGEVNFFRKANGEVYGFTVDGKIFIDPRVATAETAVHEYAHLWAEALREVNREEWGNVVKLMKGTKVWDEVRGLYPELKSDDEVADEVLSMYSGRRGAERLREEMRKVMEGNGSLKERAAAVSALGRVRDALKKFWRGVADFLGIHFTTAEEVADRVMADMLSGVDPTRVKKSERVKKQIVGERGTERMDDAERTRVRGDNLKVAKEMEKEGKDAKMVKLATGWERGRDGMWRYEVGDLRVKGDARVDMERGRTRVIGRNVSEPIGKLGDLIVAKDLFKAYPELRDVKVVVDKGEDDGSVAYYSKLYNCIALRGDRDFFKKVHAPIENGEAISKERERLKRLYDGLSEEEKLFADDGLDHFGGFTEEDLAWDDGFQRLVKKSPKVAAYIREALSVPSREGGEVIGYRLNDDERTNEVLTHEVQHVIQELEGFEGGGNVRMGERIARERGKLTEMEQKFVDDVRLYDEMMSDERSREKYPLVAFIRDNVRDGVYDEDFGKGLLGMSDEGLRAEAERLMEMGGERLDGMEAYRRLAGEVEARNASTRRGMGVDEKRGSLLEETEDVERSEQILQRGGDGGQMSKNNESSTSERTASELGQPTQEGAALATFDAKVDRNAERSKNLINILQEIDKKNSLGAHELLHEIGVALGSKAKSTDRSLYFDLGDGRTLRLANHQGDANTFARNGKKGENYGVVIKLSNSRFKSRGDVDYAEFVYYGDKIVDGERQKALVNGIERFVRTGDADAMPKPDKLNVSGDGKRLFREEVSSRIRKALVRVHEGWRQRVREVAEGLGMGDRVMVVESADDVDGATQGMRGAKGWYDPRTGKVVVVLGRHRGLDDVMRTVLHEVVAHYGLRGLVGKDGMEVLMDGVFERLDEGTRKRVAI